MKTPDRFARIATVSRVLSGLELKVVVGLTMLGRAEDDWCVQVGSYDLAETCGVSRTSVKEILDGLEKRKLLTVREGASRRKSIYRLEWMRVAYMEPEGGPKIKPQETNGTPGSGVQFPDTRGSNSDHPEASGSNFLTTRGSNSDHPEASGSNFLTTRGSDSDHPEASGSNFLTTRGSDSDHPEQPNLDGLGGQHLADLAPRTRTDFDFDFDLNLNDQSIDRMLKAELKDFDPCIVEEAGNMLLGYMKTPHLCSVQNVGPCPPVLLAQFLAVAPWPELRALLYDLRGERREAYSYAFFVSSAAQRIRHIDPKTLRKARVALSSLPGKRHAKKSHSAETQNHDPDFGRDLVSEAVTAQSEVCVFCHGSGAAGRGHDRSKCGGCGGSGKTALLRKAKAN